MLSGGLPESPGVDVLSATSSVSGISASSGVADLDAIGVLARSGISSGQYQFMAIGNITHLPSQA